MDISLPSTSTKSNMNFPCIEYMIERVILTPFEEIILTLEYVESIVNILLRNMVITNPVPTIM